MMDRQYAATIYKDNTRKNNCKQFYVNKTYTISSSMHTAQPMLGL